MAGKLNLPGTVVPPLTPFNQNLEVDYGLLKKEIDYTITSCKADAISVAGVETSEYQYLNSEDRKELINRTIDFIGNRCYVIVGVSHPSVKIVKELIDLAVDRGADAIQVLAPNRPYGGPSTQGEILEYYKILAKYSSLPVMVYHNPGPGANMSPETLAKLSRIDNVEYFKESSRDMKHLVMEIESIEGEGSAHVFTTMEVLLNTLLLGASGGTMPPPAAYLGQRVNELFKKGDISGAVEVQKKFSLFPGKFGPYGLAPLMKFAMNSVGVDVGKPFPPFDSLEGRDNTELLKTVEKMGFPKA